MKKSLKKTLVLAAGAVAAFAVVRHVTRKGAGAHVAGWHGGGHGFTMGHEHGWGQPTWYYGGGTTDPYAMLYAQELMQQQQL